jgi:hypothetical protein
MTSANFVVLINGETSQMFQSGRGLRQGCPLSPFLFILIMEGLILLLKKGKGEGKLSGVKVSRLVKILHLFFVDDVLIISKASPDEWQEIKNILSIFCRASGLMINWSKSIFYFSKFNGDALENLKGIFPHCFEELDKGFHYLGYVLKADAYKAVYWRWLLKKIEDRIGMWCNRWLTLGGGFTLVK